MAKAKEFPCEVCGAPEEWKSGHPRRVKAGDHHLCAEHRDAWFGWGRERDLLLKKLGYEDLPEKSPEKGAIWDNVFSAFVSEAKGEMGPCPYCGQVMERG